MLLPKGTPKLQRPLKSLTDSQETENIKEYLSKSKPAKLLVNKLILKNKNSIIISLMMFHHPLKEEHHQQIADEKVTPLNQQEYPQLEVKIPFNSLNIIQLAAPMNILTDYLSKLKESVHGDMMHADKNQKGTCLSSDILDV